MAVGEGGGFLDVGEFGVGVCGGRRGGGQDLGQGDGNFISHFESLRIGNNYDKFV